MGIILVVSLLFTSPPLPDQIYTINSFPILYQGSSSFLSSPGRNRENYKPRM